MLTLNGEGLDELEDEQYDLVVGHGTHALDCVETDGLVGDLWGEEGEAVGGVQGLPLFTGFYGFAHLVGV